MNHIEYDGSGELWISGIAAVREEPTAQFDRIVTVCQDRVEDNVSSSQEYYYFCMSDGTSSTEDKYGGSAAYSLFSEAADCVHGALYDGKTVLVHCHMGQSRSVAVSTAALGRLLEIPRVEAFGIIKDSREQAHPDSLLIGHAATYIEDHVADVRPFGKT